MRTLLLILLGFTLSLTGITDPVSKPSAKKAAEKYYSAMAEKSKHPLEDAVTFRDALTYTADGFHTAPAEQDVPLFFVFNVTLNPQIKI